jgi:hypothetical protein
VPILVVREMQLNRSREANFLFGTQNVKGCITHFSTTTWPFELIQVWGRGFLIVLSRSVGPELAESRFILEKSSFISLLRLEIKFLP